MAVLHGTTGKMVRRGSAGRFPQHNAQEGLELHAGPRVPQGCRVGGTQGEGLLFHGEHRPTEELNVHHQARRTALSGRQENEQSIRKL